MRERWPRTGKHKLMLLLRADGVEVSASTVGRILTRAKHGVLLREPLHRPVFARKRRPKRPYAVRKPKSYSVKRPR